MFAGRNSVKTVNTDDGDGCGVKRGCGQIGGARIACTVPQRDIHIRELGGVVRNLSHMDFVDFIAGDGVAVANLHRCTIPEVGSGG